MYGSGIFWKTSSNTARVLCIYNRSLRRTRDTAYSDLCISFGYIKDALDRSIDFHVNASLTISILLSS